jgi:hypothetical protein
MPMKMLATMNSMIIAQPLPSALCRMASDGVRRIVVDRDRGALLV